MELRRYLDLLRRRFWFVVEAVIVVGLIAGVASSRQAPKYVATARVFLEPGDTTGQLDPNPPNVGDPARFVQSQMDIVRSEAVAQLAASYVPGARVRDFRDHLSVTSSATSDVLTISASDAKSGRARDMANAVAKAYIENRRQAAVASLQQASKAVSDLLGPLQATIADLSAKIAAANAAGQGGSVDTGALTASRDAATTQYQALYARQQDLAANIGLQHGGAEIIASASAPSQPVSPRPVRDAAAGAFAGLLVGLGIVLVREQLDDRVRSVDEVEAVVGVPVLARLPFDKPSAKHPDELAAVARPHSPLSEASRALRTSIQYARDDVPVKTVVVTSAMPGEGKSAVSANLAAVSSGAGIRTVLVSGDLRRASLPRFFGSGNGAGGLSEAVADGTSTSTDPGRARISDDWLSPTPLRPESNVGAYLARPIENLAFLPPGKVASNPAELLASHEMSNILEELANGSEMVVIDTPPVLPVTDAALLAAKADGVVVVVAMNESRLGEVKQAVEILEGANAHVLGVVINKAPKSAVPQYYTDYFEDRPPDDHGRDRRRPRRART